MNVMSRKMKVSEDTTLLWAKVFSEDKSAPIWFQVIVTGWFFATYIEFPAVTAVRYLLVVALLGVIALKSAIVLPNVVRVWPLFVMPAFAFSSILWSPYPSEALTAGRIFHPDASFHHHNYLGPGCTPGNALPHVCRLDGRFHGAREVLFD